jgi:hypothetical protein
MASAFVPLAQYLDNNIQGQAAALGASSYNSYYSDNSSPWYAQS